ncbi:uncharacterized protein LOC130809693 [Amaranthus tricolor]|uniref:uncharacterized protein LOC130809693 n=1 Tax=Amaranthus tricolor TaxID=29722 RepID=UPI0025833BFD|nr:uncharacterized protein LOC130809693 [Amaranthus tricolor]
MRTVGRGAFAPPILPPRHVPYGSRWSFDRRTRIHTGSGVGFYRDQFDLLRADQAQGIASVISSTQEEPVREIAQGILLRTQFQHFILEVVVPDTTMDEQGSSPHHADVHLEEVDLTCPDYGVGSSQGAG